jgi:speckle-type POZ protein
VTKSANEITLHIIGDMRPAVFKALLHFMYTDSYPAVDDLDRDEIQEMTKCLLVAADR